MSDVRRLPVFKSVTEVYLGVTRHYFEMLYSAPVAIACFAVGILLGSYARGSVMNPKDSLLVPRLGTYFDAWSQHTLLMLAAMLLTTIGGFAFAVRWHRFVLLGERHRAGWGAYETGYLWSSARIFFATIAIIVVYYFLLSFVPLFQLFDAVVPESVILPVRLMILTWVLKGGMFCCLLPVLSRVSLALPDVALGGVGSIRQAWSRAKGNGWRLFACWILIGVSTRTVAILIWRGSALVVGKRFDAPVGKLVLAVINLPVSIYLAMIGITMISISYREIVGYPDEGSPIEAEASRAEGSAPV